MFPRWYKPPRRRVADCVLAAARRHGVSASDIIGPSRLSRLVNIRREVVADARLAGHAFAHIGRVMKRHHTSILHLAGRV